ncbi:MAG: pitrilysin family protein [Candidatus Atribacteria bacterium]|nr:pitrilysin family protein [Candidatus Atribacteria bacterium]
MAPPVIKKTTFKNGLTLLLCPRNDSPLISVNLCLSLGSIFESPQERGISALLQETILKGTQKRDAITFNKDVEMLGATIDASSSYFTGKLAIEGPASSGDQILSLFCEVLKSPAFLPEEIEKEQNFLLSILRSLDDDPLKAAMLRFKKSFYGNHPYGSPTVGEEKSLKSFNPKNVISWYHRFYVPNNQVIAVVGQFEPERVGDFISCQLGDIVPVEIPSPSLESFRPMGLKIVDRKDIRDSWVVFGYRAPSLMETKERMAFEILSGILGGGMYSRLFRKVREERGLSYQVGSAYAPLIGPSFFCAYAGFPPQHLDSVISLLRDEFHNLVNIPPDEFNETKNYIRGIFLEFFETVFSLSSLFSFYEKIGLGADFPLRYDELIQNITLEEVQTIYRKYSGIGESLGAVVPAHPEHL